MEYRNVLLVGGSGFLGSHIAHRLAGSGCRVTVPTRRRSRAAHLLPLPTVDVVEADVHDPHRLAQLMAGQDAVINCVGILHSRSGRPYGRDFAQVHVELPRRLVAACRQAGVHRLLHVSALGAARGGPSEYQRSRADGEAAIRETGSGLAWTVFRPSVIFGPGDRFLNLFAGLLRVLPVMPLGGAGTRFQPVYVEDVAAVIADSLPRGESFGHTYELCGPGTYTLAELVRYVGAVTGRRRPVFGLPAALAYVQALLLEFAPGRLMSRDNLRSMQVDNVCHGCTLPFGRQATALESVAPGYLAGQGVRARYTSIRTRAGR
ncbi:MAG: complex I NDUFA9 subunit family protein [Betaproteobacteria bacterium]|nr:complex I NDUFA9 subunit family protein [Betaproteobacteria bacterium]